MNLSFTVLGRPQVAGSKRAFINPKTGKPIITDTNKLKGGYMQGVKAVAWEAKRVSEGVDHPEPWEGAIELYVDFYLTRPKSHRGAKGLKPSAPHHHTTKPDTTKLLRCLEDALTNVVWRDDTQVVRQHVSKNYGDPERTEVRVIRVDV